MKTIINTQTGEIITRELNADELAQQTIDEIASAEIEAEKAQAEAKRLAALAKLEALGLVEDDLKALGL